MRVRKAMRNALIEPLWQPLLLGTALGFALVAQCGVTVYVAPNGSDAAPGTLEQPFRTLQHGVAMLTPGDTCMVRAGVYRETVTLTASGVAGNPVRIRAYPGERVLLDGTEPIQGEWRRADGLVWEIATPLTFEQLFAGEQMLLEARWPNCAPDQVLTRAGWASAGPKSEYQKLRDPQLARTGIDWNGATAILNVAHQFWSWSRVVEGYVPGSDTLPYTITMNPFHSENRNWWGDDYYYLMGKREALDVEGEWLLQDGILSLGAAAPPQGIRVKQRDYAFQGKSLRFVEISGFCFFGCTFRLDECAECVVEYCTLLYPSYARGVPNAEEDGRRRPCPGTTVTGRQNVVRSCSFEHCPNFGVVLRGDRNLLEDCIVQDVNWTGTLHYTAVALLGSPGLEEPRNSARHNTLYNVGNTIVNCSGPYSVVEYNHVHHGGLISADVSLLYTCMPAANGVEFRYNWVHDSLSPNHSLGIRGDDKTRGFRVHHNVIWNVAKDGIVAKGGRNRVYNNTCFANGASDLFFNSGPEPDKWWQKHVTAYPEQNVDSLLINNCAWVIASVRRPTQPPLPGDHSHNFSEGDPKLADPLGLDFRPAVGSPLIDAGRVVEGITAPFVGTAPDIGAYEFGGEHWLPGHRNGIWLSRAPLGDFRVRLNLPILEDVRVSLRQGTRELGAVRFTPANWAVPQPVPGDVSTAADLTFGTPAWGETVVPGTLLTNALMDARAQFARPDLASARVVDSRPRFNYEENYAADSVGLPVFRAWFHERAPLLDGSIGSDEYPGWSPARAIPLDSLGAQAPELPPAGEGYALLNSTDLYLAVRVAPGGDAPHASGGTWGPNGSGGVEVDLAPAVGATIGPVFVLHAYPSGNIESVTDGGTNAEAAARFGAVVTYAARILTDGSWNAELRIPLAALAAGPPRPGPLRFNLGLRRNGAPGGPWFAAVKTGGANYDLAGGAVLQMDPGARAEAPNLLRHADFEQDDLTPWILSTNQPESAPEGTVARVREGRRGDWCMRLRADDPKLMAQQVFKWTHPLAAGAVSPGRYCLSYDIRVVGRPLTPWDAMGSFNSYVHIRRDGKPGGNLGQMPSMLTSTNDRWLRRDLIVEIPERVEPGMVALQLHRATGAVLIDSVSLIRCEE